MKDGEELLERPRPDDRKDPRLLEQTHLEQLTQNAAFRELVDALANVVSVHVVPQVAKNLIRSQDVALRDAPGSDFIEQLASLPAKKQVGAMRRLETLLKKAVPQFAELKIVREPRTGIPHLEAKYRHWRPTGSWQNEQEFSDGTLRLVGMLWAVLEGDAPLLLQEPELSLHEAVVRQLPRLIARAAEKNGRQIIVTTHAEEMLNDRSVDPSEVLYLVTTGEETQVHLASEDEAIHAAVAAKVPLGRLVNGRTRPAGIEQMSLAFPESSSR